MSASDVLDEPKTTRSLRRPRRRRTAATTLTHRQVTEARKQARAERERRAAIVGRSLPRERDPQAGMKEISTRLVRRVAAYIDADPDLMGWITERVEANKTKAGRPCEVTVRTAFICFAIQAVHFKSLNFADLAAMPEGMSWRSRRHLGIDYLRNGTPTTVTYTQFLDMFHRIAECFDAWDEKLVGRDDEEEIRAERAEALQTLVDRWCAATTRFAPLSRGNVAIDATFKWAWERPPGSLKGKVPRKGADGDDGPPLTTEQLLSVSDVLGSDADDIDPGTFSTVEPQAVTEASLAGRTKRKASWPSTWSLGAAWIGNANKTKAVHGYAFHSLVRTDADGPTLIDGFTVTPAQGDPAAAVVPVLRRLYDRRADDDAVLAAVEAGEARLLGDITADPAYTAAGIRAWQLPLKALGATPIARLHRTNQDGPRLATVGRGKRQTQIMTISGRPVCECVAFTPLAALRFPKFPYRRDELDAYQAQIVKLAAFEAEPNGAPRPDGRRQYRMPHGGAATGTIRTSRAATTGGPGGCELCVLPDGSAVIDDDGRPRPRCCTARTRLIGPEVTALDMGMIHGSPEWYDRWNPRNRVEGSYGILKNLAVTNWSRNYHHFVGLARETLVALFVVLAYNDHMLRNWRARQDMAEVRATEGLPMPSARVTETGPGSSAVAERQATAGSKKSRRPRRGPKGMDFLGPPPEPPPL